MNMRHGLLLAAIATGAPAGAQTLSGRVLDAATGDVVPQVQVTATTAQNRTAGRALTDAAGHFMLPLRNAGEYRIRAERTGYQATLTQAVDVGPRDTVEVDVRVSAEPLRVEALTVTARRQPPRRPSLDAAGFYRRERLGGGYFLHREDIERNANMNVAQIIDRLPGTRKIRSSRSSANGELIVFERSSNSGSIIRAQLGQAQHCPPQVYLDGIPMQYDANGLNGFLQPDALEAVEVYASTSQVPAEYNTNASCGVILLWSKKER